MNLAVKIEIRSIVKKVASQLLDGSTHNFTVLVQGPNGNQIEYFVKQVVFNLPSNKQVKQNPPYIVSGSAHASFRLPIEIYLHTSEARNKVSYSYYVHLPNKPVESAVNVKTWTFLNTPQDFRQRLLRGGAEVVRENSLTVETEVKSEPVETTENQDANTQNEIQNDLPNTSIQTKDTSEQIGTWLIQDVYSFDDLMKENEGLKKENEELFQKFTQHEGVIGTYIEKLPALQNDWSAASTELNKLQKKSEDIEAEILSLKSAIQALKSERLPQNEVNEIKRRKKKQTKTSAESSSSISESLPCFTSTSEKDSNSKSSHNVLLKDKEMVTTQRNVDTTSHVAFDSSGLSAESNIIQDACESQLKSGCGTSKNLSSSFSHLNVSVNPHDTVQNAPIMDTFFDASHNETDAENSHNLPVRNNSSSFNTSNNIASTCSSEKESSENIFSNCNITQKIMCSVPLSGLANDSCAVKGSIVDESSLETVTVGENIPPSPEGERPRKRHGSKPRLQTISSNSMGSVSDKLTSRYTTSSNCEGIPAVNSSLQTESVKSLSMKEIQEQAKEDFLRLENSLLNKRTIFLPIPEDIKQKLCSVKQKSVSSAPHSALENNSDAAKKSIIDEQACLPVDSSLGTVTIGDNIASTIPVDTKNTVLENKKAARRKRKKEKRKALNELKRKIKASKSIGSVSKDINDRPTSENTMSSSCESLPAVNSSLQTESIKSLSAKGGLKVNLNQQKMDPAVSDFLRIENPSLDKRTIFSPIPGDIKQNLCSAEQKIVSSVPHTAFENKSGRQSTMHEPVESSLDTVTIEDNTFPSIAVENKNTKRKNKKRFKRRNKPKLNYNTWLLSHSIKSLGSVSKDIDNRPISENMNSSSCGNIPAVNSSVQKESTKCLSMKNIQEQAKNRLQVDLNLQKTDPVVADFLHLENPSLDKRTIFLPIPEDLKQNFCSAKERIVSSVLHTDLGNNSDSGKPVESSLDTVTIRDNTSSSIAVESKNSEPQDEKSLKRKKERRKGFKRRKSETESFDSIASVLKDVDDGLISEAKQNYYAHLLTEFLTNPKKCRDISTMIFRVVDHLRNTTKNYLQSFQNERENCIFLPSSESCIVSSLFEIEEKDGTSQFKLIENILITIRHLLLSAKKISDADGLASLCRVFTEICRRKNYLTKPLSLCADILKMRLRRAPYLIASIAGVWKEPFMLPSDQSEEAMILLGSISLAVGKKLQGGKKKLYSTEDDATWSYSVELITEYFGFPSLPDIEAAINFLKESIISNCTQNLSVKLWMVTSAFVILASYQPWKWTQAHLLDEFIMPNLSKFANEEPNKTAFALFCDLCVEVNLLRSQMSNEVFMKYFEQTPNEGSSFVKEWAAVSLAKYSILSKRLMSVELQKWIKNSVDKSSVESIRELILRMKMYKKGLKSAKGVVIA